MKIMKEVKVGVEIEVSFEDACKVILSKAGKSTCRDYEKIVRGILREYNHLSVDEDEPDIPIVDLMKDEVLEKMKNEFSLEKIEQLYERFRSTNSIPS